MASHTCIMLRGLICRDLCRVTGYRGRLLHSSTGLSNLPEHNHRLSLRFQHMSARTHRTPSNGSISTTALVPWDAKTFCTEVNWWMRRMKVFEDAVHRASLEASLTPVIVYYEALQNDLYSTLKVTVRFHFALQCLSYQEILTEFDRGP